MENGPRDWVRKTMGTGAGRPAAAEPLVAPEAELPESRPQASSTFIDEGAEFQGTLRLTGTFRIDAEFRGEIVSDGTVIIGEAAGVQAHVRAREVVIAGALVGDVHASRMLAIRASGRLQGDVEAPCLEIERGGSLNGTTRMVHPDVARRAQPEASAPAKKEAGKKGAAQKPDATPSSPA